MLPPNLIKRYNIARREGSAWIQLARDRFALARHIPPPESGERGPNEVVLVERHLSLAELAEWQRGVTGKGELVSFTVSELIDFTKLAIGAGKQRLSELDEIGRRRHDDERERLEREIREAEETERECRREHDGGDENLEVQ